MAVQRLPSELLDRQRQFKPSRTGLTPRGAWIGRYYDPSTGQFLTLDPLTPQTEEPYAYAGGNPVSNVDPRGLYHYRYSESVGPIAQAGSPEFAMAAFEADPATVFPFPITGCSTISKGSVCTLSALDLLPGIAAPYGTGQVVVSNTSPTSFTFTVISQSYFDPPGSTITFGLSDQAGSLTLTQTAHAPEVFTNFLAPLFARFIWDEQAANLSLLLSRTTGPLQRLNGVERSCP
jgi:RHS repeat-associated protein